VTTRSTSLRSTCRIPVKTVEKISTATRMDSATLEASPIPSRSQTAERAPRAGWR
jgi:hypothetical protein